MNKKSSRGYKLDPAFSLRGDAQLNFSEQKARLCFQTVTEVKECPRVDRKVRGDGYAARSRKARDAGRPGVVVWGNSRSEGVASGEEGRDAVPTELVFFHQIYQSQIGRLTMRKRRCSPPESTVPAMPDYRRGPSAGGEDDGSGQRQTWTPAPCSVCQFADQACTQNFPTSSP